jgi:CubicO group peptidase (beta-lactamase class C family)
VTNQAERIAAELAARLAAYTGQNRLPGATAGVVCGDELAWLGGTGFAETATAQATDPSMLYGIASVTKTFTGTAIMQLRDAGRLGLDDPAVAWLPELGALASPFGPVDLVTIRRMLSHESGLPAEPPGTDWAVPAYQGAPETTLRRAGEISVQFPPHARHGYSDLAYQWLGEIVTRASGTSYPEYIRAAILEPLGMTATGFPPLPASLLARRATGYDWRGLSDDLDPAPPMPPVWAEGGLWSCVADLAKWVSFQLSAYQTGAYRSPAAAAPVLAAPVLAAPVLADPVLADPVLAAASLREMHKPRYLADDQWTQAWGISWCGTRREEVTWVGHSGGIPGFTSTICFDPAAQVGAVVLANGTSASVAVGMELAVLARELTPARRPAPPPPMPPPRMPEHYRPLLGIYARPGLGGWLQRLEWRDGQLTFTVAESPEWRVVLRPSADPDRFAIADGSSVPGSVTFRRSADGRVVSAFFLDITWARLDRVTA